MTDFDVVMERENNGSKKWNRDYITQRFGPVPKKFYPMFIADMDFKIDDTIQESVYSVFLEGDFGYFDIEKSFYTSIVDWYKTYKNIEIREEWIVPSVGTVSSLFFAAASCCQPTGFLVLTPAYGVFADVARTYGELHTLALTNKNNRYYIDFVELENKIVNEAIKTLIFCNPHNPSGRVWSKQELARLVSICKKFDVTILSDEIHGDFCKIDDEFISLIEFNNSYEKIIVANSPNKIFNLSGLCSSYILTNNAEFREKIRLEMEKYHISPNRIGLKYLEMSYRYGDRWLNELITYVRRNIKYTISKLSDLDVEVFPVESSYLVWIKLPKIKDSHRFIIDLARDTGVLLETGNRFIADYEQCIRINVATSYSMVCEAIDIFSNYYREYTIEDNLTTNYLG